MKKLIPFLLALTLNNSCSDIHKTIKANDLSIYQSYAFVLGNDSKIEFFKQEDDCKISGPNGRYMPVNKFYKISMSSEKAKNYVTSIIDKVKSVYNKNKELNGLELAVMAIDFVRKDLDVVSGKGFYTSKHELSYEKFQMILDIGLTKQVTPIMSFPDSTQTLEQFISHKSGKFEGDCDDFASALLTSYELMKKLCSNNKGEFYDKLRDGLDHYKIVYVLIEGKYVNHAMNASLLINNDKTIKFMHIIEPQVYYTNNKNCNLDHDEIKVIDNKPYVIRYFKSLKPEKCRLLRFHDKDGCYGPR